MYKANGRKTRVRPGDVMILKDSRIRIERTHRSGRIEVLEWGNDEHGTASSVICGFATSGPNSFKMFAINVADMLGLGVDQLLGSVPRFVFF